MDETSESTRYCTVCGKPLPESVSKKASTHPGSCRERNTQSLLKKHNKQVKIDKITMLLRFLEERFRRGVDIDTLSNVLSSISMFHAPMDDFVMTAYYIETINISNIVSIHEIQDAADAWDDVSGGKRSLVIKQQIVKQCTTIERYHDVNPIRDALKRQTWRCDITNIINDANNVPDNEYSLYIRRAYSRIRRSLNQKYGYNKNAYKILRRHIDVNTRDADEQTRNLLRATAISLAIDRSLIDSAIALYDGTLAPALKGKDVAVVTGGILYYIAKINDISLSQEAIALAVKTSSPSIRKIYSIIVATVNTDDPGSVQE